MPSVFRRAFRLDSDRRRRMELRQLDFAVAVRGAHDGDVSADSNHIVDVRWPPSPIGPPLARFRS
jgi:hypothetical protein